MLAETTVTPAADDRQSRCVTYEEVSTMIAGTYPLGDLDARLDHIDHCPNCIGKMVVIAAVATAHLDFAS